MTEEFMNFATFAVKFIVVYSCLRFCQLLAQMYINKFFIVAGLESSIHNYSRRLATHPQSQLNPETHEIVHAIIRQMTLALEYHQKKILRHAIEEHAILFTTLVWLPTLLTDPNLFEALDILKQKFYTMHGVYPNPKNRDRRNKLDLRIQTTSGKDLTKHFDNMRPNEIAAFLREIEGTENSGCNIMVHMSIINPVTPKKYDYKKFIRD